MNKLPLLGLFGFSWFLFFPDVLAAKIERHVTRTFEVQPGGTLNIRTSGGSISVGASPTATAVTIDVLQRIAASSESEADELLKQLTLTFEQNGSDVTSTARHEPCSHGWFRFFSQRVQCSYTVTVPARFNVDLKTSGGGITVGDLSGRVAVATSGGGLKIGRIDGAIAGHTSGGAISIAACTGDVEVGTSGGGIRVGPIAGKAKLNTSGGGISVREVAGPIQAHTSGGPIDVSLSGPVTGDCTFATSGGGITVHLPAQAQFTLDAQTSGGRVHSQLPVESQTSDQRGRLAGKVNGGGPALKLRSSGGGISLVAR